jgi:hypothetical protein
MPAEIIVVLVVNIATTLLKKYVQPKFGDTGVHVVLFLCSFVGALGYYFKKTYPPFGAFMVTVGGIFVLAISLYEVLLKYFPVFKQKQ